MPTNATSSTRPRETLFSYLLLHHLPALTLHFLPLEGIHTFFLMFFLLIDHILPQLDLQPMPMILIQVHFTQWFGAGVENLQQLGAVIPRVIVHKLVVLVNLLDFVAQK